MLFKLTTFVKISDTLLKHVLFLYTYLLMKGWITAF